MAQGFLTGEPGTTTESMGRFQDVLDLLEVQHKHTLFWGKDSHLPSDTKKGKNPTF